MLSSIHASRLDALRQQLVKDGLDGFVIPICDEHMSEYVGAYAQRLEWLTGFGGSAGTAVVLKDRAAIFIDGRYTLQVREQVDGNLYDYVGIAEQSPAQWLGEHAPEGAAIGYDAWLHTQNWVRTADQFLAPKKAAMQVATANAVDMIWQDRPRPSLAPIDVQPQAFAGKASAEKRDDIVRWLKEKGADAVVIAALDSIAWLYNIRGKDIEHTPVVRGYAIVEGDGSARLFVENAKLTDDVHAHLANMVGIYEYADFAGALQDFNGKNVAVDPERSVAAIFENLEQGGAKISKQRDPVVLAKAIKNDVEIKGHRAAQARDGAALSQFLHWMSENGGKGDQDELSVAAKLQDFRQRTGALEDLSFATISGSGPHGAVVHYRVSEETNRPLDQDSLYLVDSGGQYRDGTTDVTRTLAIGTPTDEMITRYTQVLQGHIALARAVFPRGTTGTQIDVLARQFLWADGVDYAHGTGHGVGAYLSVHEGPQRIAGYNGPAEPLQPGMICSNEPGYYKDGEFGIRIENLVLVEERAVAGAEQPMLGFETLTHAPLDKKLIKGSMLSAAERAWIDTYHADTFDIVAPQLEGAALAWLQSACGPLDGT